MKKRNKLVRDLVVAGIQAKGDPCTWHYATEKEKPERLGFKLLEECEEFANAKNPEELIDVMEVVGTVCDFGKHALPSEEVLAVCASAAPNAGDAEDVLLTRIFELVDAASEYVVRRTDDNFVQLAVAVEAVIIATGFERATLELMRLNKLKTHGGFEQWIILDES